MCRTRRKQVAVRESKLVRVIEIGSVELETSDLFYMVEGFRKTG